MGNKPEGVRKGSESSIEIDFYYRGVRCKERVKLPPTPRNIKYCEKWKATIEHEIAKGEFNYRNHFPESPRIVLFSSLPGDTLQVGDYLTTWLATERARIRHSTLVGYQKILQYHLIPEFGTMRLTELRRKHLYAWADKHPNMSAKRARNILSPLRIALNAAVKRELIQSTPFNDFKLDKRSNGNGREDTDPFSSEERVAILNVLDGQAQNFVQLAFWTGLRTSELIALDWPDIDWIRGVVVVSRTLTPELCTESS